MYLLAMCMSSLEKRLFRPFPHFLIQLFIFLILGCRNYLYILEIHPLLVASFAISFFHFEDCLFLSSFLISFTVQKLLSLIRSNLFIFVFISIK